MPLPKRGLEVEVHSPTGKGSAQWRMVKADDPCDADEWAKLDLNNPPHLGAVLVALEWATGSTQVVEHPTGNGPYQSFYEALPPKTETSPFLVLFPDPERAYATVKTNTVKTNTDSHTHQVVIRFEHYFEWLAVRHLPDLAPVAGIRALELYTELFDRARSIAGRKTRGRKPNVPVSQPRLTGIPEPGAEVLKFAREWAVRLAGAGGGAS